MSESASPLAADEFSGRFIGRPAFWIRDARRAAEALRALPADARGAVMVTAKAPAADVEAVGELIALGFRVIDANVQLDCLVSDLAPGPVAGETWRIREARPDDREAVARVAGDNLTTSRFHLDPAIDNQAACRLKRAWVSNFFDGLRGERLLVAEGANGVGGFLQALERGNEGVIDLIAVDPGLRGTGATAALVRSWAVAAPALSRLTVGTQLSNVRSMRAYGRMGFRVCATTYVLHCHGDAAALRAAGEARA